LNREIDCSRIHSAELERNAIKDLLRVERRFFLFVPRGSVLSSCHQRLVGEPIHQEFCPVFDLGSASLSEVRRVESALIVVKLQCNWWAIERAV
jgi:hypothetical protein